MKKLYVAIILLFSLSSCDFQSRADFEKEMAKDNAASADIEMPKITYQEDGGSGEVVVEDFERREGEEDFAKLYGDGKIGKSIAPETAVGNLIETRIDESQIAISLIASVQSPGGYSTLLSYKKDGGLIEREFGPVAGIADQTTTVTYDKIETESGPMLLVSQVSANSNESYSAYYLFNKYMGLVDYLVFRTSVNQIMPTVERLGDLVQWTDMAYTGTIEQAIDKRKDAESMYFPSLFDVYNIKMRPVTALVNGKEIEIGSIPDVGDENRILLAKTTANPNSPGRYLDLEQ